MDSAHQIFVEIAVTNQAAPLEHLLPVLSKMLINIGELPEKASADTGYHCEKNDAYCEDNEVDAYIATKRDRHGESPGNPIPETLSPAIPESNVPPDKLPPKAKMAVKLKTEAGKAVYRSRKAIVEPVFGQI